MTDQNPREQWQAMFLPASMLMGAMQKNAQTFWHAQNEILNEMHAFAEGWFQRRHIGAQAAQEACERMCQAKTPMESFHEYQAWCTGAFQRLMADSSALQQELKKIADDVSPALVPSAGERQSDAEPATAKRKTRVEA